MPFADGLGREVVTRYTSGLASGGAWESDSNCRDAQARVRDHRRSFNYTVFEPVAGNFVPVNCFQSLADRASGTTMGVAVDRSMAGASLIDGSLEFMLHRRIMADDGRGVGEPLNETGLDGNGLIVRGVQRLVFAPAAEAGARLRAVVGHELFHEHLQFATNTAASPAAWIAANTATYSMLARPLPANLHVVTLHAQSPTMALLRIGHMFAVGEDAILSGPATVELATLFAAFRIESATELMLPGTAPLTSAPVTTFMTRDGNSTTLPVVYPAPAGPGLAITLHAMEIRTFRCQIAYS